MMLGSALAHFESTFRRRWIPPRPPRVAEWTRPRKPALAQLVSCRRAKSLIFAHIGAAGWLAAMPRHLVP